MLGTKKKSSGATSDRVFFQNSMKTLVANIRFASVDNPIRTIGVTSSVPNEGKSSVSVSLAQALASSGKDTLLVDCDLRRRSVANILGTHAQYGIYGVLSGQVDLDDAIVETSTPGLYFLDCEPHIPNPVDILASKRFKNLVELMRNEFGYVVIDTPPITAFVDGAVVSTSVDGTLMVVRRDFTRRDEVTAAYEQLKKAGANVIGSVLNFCESERSEYYYSYYNKDGKRVRKSKGSSSAPAPKLPDKPLAQQNRSQAKPSTAHVAERVAAAAPAVAKPSDPEPMAPGLKPLPSNDLTPADSTMAFLQQSGYQPRSYDE